MKITLILPDLHHRVDQADKIIRHVEADEVICLGDVFDDFNDYPEMVNHTADWFVDFVNNPKHIFIAGNHDCHYGYDVGHLRCSGYAQWKSFIINDIVSRRDWEKMKFFHILDGKWLLSHGGLHKFYLPKQIADLHTNRPRFFNELEAYLTEESHKAFRESSWFTHAGHARGGFQRVGGLTWCDFEREFYPIKGLNQIIGHTAQGIGFPKWCVFQDEKVAYYPQPQWTPSNTMLNDVNVSVNIDLDVSGNMHWATWDGENLRVFSCKNDL